ncbi:hypothetical protein E2C01_060350 [Portunus trituberculatus]|uniref:Uncharacterized protein n=1 Tax=Portunus trituberculatus TaxID=210409 RepID=A0A5B7HBT5_PORTR|nr:hypothetical protein [Portunus trituberculatus]
MFQADTYIHTDRQTASSEAAGRTDHAHLSSPLLCAHQSHIHRLAAPTCNNQESYNRGSCAAVFRKRLALSP